MELTEREKKLIDYLKVMINALTINSLFENRTIELWRWRASALDSIGFSTEWQDDMLKTLADEFELKYRKIDDKGNEFKEETKNGN